MRTIKWRWRKWTAIARSLAEQVPQAWHRARCAGWVAGGLRLHQESPIERRLRRRRRGLA